MITDEWDRPSQHGRESHQTAGAFRSLGSGKNLDCWRNVVNFITPTVHRAPTSPNCAALAGSEITAGALSWWCRAMLAYPQTQARVQEELDVVVGRGRLPSFADRPHLPYTHAMVKEVLRWRLLLPFGIPHLVTADDWYEGIFIPKGTICFPNIWQCNHQVEVYGSDADEFIPARFLDEHGQLASGPSDAKEDGHRTYGYGRRSCVGKYLANDSLFIDIATMLWAMKFEPQKDASGKEIPVNLDMVGDGLIMYVHLTV